MKASQAEHSIWLFQEFLLSRYLKNIKKIPVAIGGSKWIFCCPFCSALGRTESKRDEPKGALLWNDLLNSWVFYCVRQGSAECSGRGKTLEWFLYTFNDDLAEQYRIDRSHSGTTGKGYNCPIPASIQHIQKDL